jgi:hypothetical protein
MIVMKPLSPVDAIAPAFSRIRTVLTPPSAVPGQPAPFRFWFFFKIALVAALTQSSFYGVTVSLLANGLSIALTATGAVPRHHPSFFLAGPGFAAGLTVALVLAGLLGVVLWLLIGWFWCRLRFAFFDLVVYRQGRVGLAWSRYGAQAWRFLGLMLLIALALLLLLAITAGPLILHFILTLRRLTPQAINANPAVIFEHILPMYGIIFLFVFVAAIVDAVAEDFLLPPMAIQDAPLDQSFARFFHLLRERFWSVILYLVLRFAIAIGITYIGILAIFLVFAILGGAGAAIGFLLFHAFWHAGPLGITVFILYCLTAGLILAALYLFAMITLHGVMAAFKQSYAAYYFGSHYPELGDRLDPPADRPPALPDPPPTAI